MGKRVEEDSGIDGARLRALAAAVRPLAPEGRWWPYDDPFEVAVSAILTQRARWEGAQRAMDNLRAANLLTPGALAAAPAASVEACVRTAGFYRQKAKALRGIAGRICTQFSGRMDNVLALATDELRRELLSWRGVGEETADAILVFAAGRPAFVVDAYAIRLMRRFGALPPGATPSYGAVSSAWRAAGARTVGDAQALHAAVVDLSKTVCAAEPACARCPLEGACARAI